MKEPPEIVTKWLVGNDVENTHPNICWFIMVPFSWIGSLLYVVIGLPICGLIVGWIITRDEIMGKYIEEKDKKEG